MPFIWTRHHCPEKRITLSRIRPQICQPYAENTVPTETFWLVVDKRIRVIPLLEKLAKCISSYWWNLRLRRKGILVLAVPILILGLNAALTRFLLANQEQE